MRRVSLLFLCLSLMFVCSITQAQQVAATANQLNFFHHMLMTIGSLDYSSDVVQMYEAGLVRQFGFDQQEADLVHSAGESFNATLKQLRQAAAAITVGKATLSSADLAALANIDAQRADAVRTLANQILNAVRPEVATRLRFVGDFVAAATGKGGN